MEHLDKENNMNRAISNNELNKPKAPHRVSSLSCEPGPARLMEKQYSASAAIRLLMETAQTIIRSVVAPQSKEVPLKKNVKNYFGIDIAADTFAISLYQSPDKPVTTKDLLPNNKEGFQQLLTWLTELRANASNCVICMEATGVYGEAISHYLVAQGFKVAIEPPLKVKRAFNQNGHKTDAVDSTQIAEYAYRFFDELRFWCSPSEVSEKIKHFLSARELLTKQSVATQNALVAYKRHVIKDQAIIDMYQNNVTVTKEQIKIIDQHINELIKSNPSFHELSLILVSLCGIGSLLAAYLIVTTNGFQTITDFKHMASFIGICPFQHQSGTSVYRNASSRPFGPEYIRKLLHLAARSVAMHNIEFRKYYYRKLEEGKCKKVALNNIANKLLKISFAMVRNHKQYIKDHRSINPLVLQNA